PARLNTDATLDPTFGAGGKAFVNLGANPGGANDDEATSTNIALTPFGGILLAGQATTATGTVMAVVRLTANGTLDTTFGTSPGGGFTLLNIAGGGNFDAVDGIVVQADSKIVISGYTTVSPARKDIVVARLTPDGRLDTTFNATGILTFN